MTTARFKPLPPVTAQRLADFISTRNLNTSLTIDGQTFTLIYISHNTSAFFKSRGLSAYFKTGRSIVRISDHWAASQGYERSRKLNCGSISGKRWIIDGDAKKVYATWRSGRFPWEMLAGICGLTALNKTCDHFTA